MAEYVVRPDETTTQALRRLGFGHRPNGHQNYTRTVYRLSDGAIVDDMLVGDANEWIRRGCPMPEGGES